MGLIHLVDLVLDALVVLLFFLKLFLQLLL